MALGPEALERWRRAKATLAEEQAEHDREWRDRRLRRAELEQAISARRAELRAGRRAERAKADALRESVAKFVEKQMQKAEDGRNASK
jgi:hypothetical protein